MSCGGRKEFIFIVKVNTALHTKRVVNGGEKIALLPQNILLASECVKEKKLMNIIKIICSIKIPKVEFLMKHK